MQFKIYIFFVTYSLFCNEYDPVITMAFVGQNVRRARQEEFSFVVSLKTIDNQNDSPEDDHQCTGSLISSTDILTVSHAVERLHLNKFEVIFGSVDIRSNSKRYPAWWINYNQWAKRRKIHSKLEEDDIAMIRLTEAVPNEIIPAIILPLPRNTLYGENITLAGWGHTMTAEVQRYLQTGVATIMTTKECETRVNVFLGRPGRLTANVVCSAVDPFVLSTPGDSGGPVLYLDYIVAVHIGILPDIGSNLLPVQVNFHLLVHEFTSFITYILELR